jgi:cytochrome c oxidase cbb3-type subunit III
MTARLLAAALLLALTLSGCYREKREFQSPPPNSPADPVKASEIRPGGGPALQPGSKATPDRSHLDENAYAVNQGKRLFRWYNCSGCHGGGGGGGMGATLIDAGWRYGGEPAAIYATIVEGRPNGMPAFGGRIPDDQVWQLVAYVRSMSGNVRKDVAPSRSDAMSGAPPENERPEAKPKPEAPASSPP